MSVVNGGSRRTHAFCTLFTGSAMAVCLAVPGAAHAACAPNPTVTGGVTTCSSIESGGLSASAVNSSIDVVAGAVVMPGTNPASIVLSNQGGVGVKGTVNGGTVVGLQVTNGLPYVAFVPYDPYAGASYTPPPFPGTGSFQTLYPSTSASLVVASGGLVTGATGVQLKQLPNNTLGGVTLSVINSGAIASTFGLAIDAQRGTSITSITNNAGGTIGAILGQVNFLSNQGTISGGPLSAVSVPGFTFLTNASGGAIGSTSTSATLALGSGTLSNAGSVANSGPGPAVSGTGSLTISNTGSIANTGTGPAIAGTTASSLVIANSGTIAATGTTAILTTGQLNLTNTKTITGSVDASGSSQAGMVNTSGGTISGSVLLGSGNDLLIGGAFDPATGKFANIGGTVDGGGGLNTVGMTVSANATLSSATLPTNFQGLALTLANRANVTLGKGLNLAAGVSISGTGTLNNLADLVTNGPAISTFYNYPTALTVNNSANITATLANSYNYALALNFAQGGSNSGSITATGGGGIYVAENYRADPFTNSGTITATGTGVSASGKFVNTGSIVSSGGVAVTNSLGGGTIGSLTSSNSGTITGTNAGLVVDTINFANTGTISATAGPGVIVGHYAGFDNQAGGTVSGSGTAVGIKGYDASVKNEGTINGDVSSVGNSFYGSRVFVSNAGTINGNVNLGTGGLNATGNTFIALDGGVVKGNLALGSGGDTFVTSLTNTGTGAYAGVTGTISGGPNETLVYRVDADTTTTLAAPGGIFSTVGYDLAKSVKLTLTSIATSSAAQSFTGTGTVNLTADITGTGTSGQPLIDLNRTSPRSTSANAIALTSNGKLTVTNTSLQAYSGIAAGIGTGSSFTNTGTITVNDTAIRPGYLGMPFAILSNGGSVSNSGTLTIGGVIGIDQQPGYYGTSTKAAVNNSGTISQLAGAADAIGVAGTFTLTNTGTISTGGAAVLFNGSTSSVTNSGLISSSHAPAITDGTTRFGFFSPTNQVVNQAGGTISGGAGQAAIALGGGGVVANAGTINGDVVFGSATNPYADLSLPGSTYIARGGTLNGNLTFGAGDDTLIVVGSSTGVTGRIDPGAGTNTYAQLYTSSTTIDPTRQTLPTGFQAFAIGASGTGTTVTVTGPAGGLNAPLSLFGDGTIHNKANVNAQTQPNMASNLVSLGQLNFALGLGNGLTFINEATIADGVSGTVAGFSNSGSIGSNNLLYGPVYLTAADGTAFSFTNSGQITGPNSASAQYFAVRSVTIRDSYISTTTRQSALLKNSGTIAGEVIASLTANQFSFTNSGTINGISTPLNGGATALSLGAYGVGSTPNLTMQDSTASLSNTASGMLNGRSSIHTTGASLSVSNAGTVNGTFVGTQASMSTYIPDPSGVGGVIVNTDQTSAKFDNSGTITSSGLQFVDIAAGILATAATVAASNSGAISAQSAQQSALKVVNQTIASNTVTVINSGSLSASGAGGSGLLVASVVAFSDAASPLKATVTVTNTGTISATGGGEYTQGFSHLPYYSYPAQISIATGLAVGASAPGGGTVSITNAAGASISATGASQSPYASSPPVPAPYNQAGVVGVIALGDTVTLTNSGTITGGPDIPTDANTTAFVSGISLPLAGTIAGGVQLYAGTATLSNTASGTINGSVALAATTTASVTNYGTINGNVTLSATNDSFVQGIGATLSGTADGGGGNDTLTIDLTGGGKLDAQLAHFTNFASTHLTGSGTVTSTSPLAVATLVLDNAAITIRAGSTLQTSAAVTLTGSTGNNTITNYGTIAGTVALGAGNDSFVEGISASTGVVDGGAGTNQLTIDVTGGGSLTQALAPFTNFQSAALTGTGTVSASTPVAASTLVLNSAALTLTSGSTLQTGGAVALTGGTGTNSFTNRGTVNGAIVGIDTLNTSGGTINIGATATTTAKFINGAADATLNINAGTLTLGQKLLNGGLVAVAGGARLIDLAGISNLVGGRITIAKGGTIVDAVDNAGTIINNGAYTADLNNLAGGSATNAAGASWTGSLTNAAAATLVNQGTVTGTVANAGTFINASGATLSGALTQSAGNTTNAGTLTSGAFISGGSLSSSGTINGLSNAGTATITGGTLSGTITNSGVLTLAGAATVSGRITNLAGGQLAGTLAFGSGNDTLTLMSGAGMTGVVDGGAGTDTLVITSTGTDAAPDEYNLTRITGFEQTTQTSGTIAVSGTYDTAQLDILAGRYIGRTG